MDSALRWMVHLSPLVVYLLLFVSSYMENIFPPIPGDTVVVIGAYLVGIGKLNIFFAFFVTTLGSIMGFMTLFFLSFVYGTSILEKKFFRNYGSSIRKVELWFEKYGYGVILLNRFLSGARSVISIFAGISKLKPKKVFIYATISCGFWNFFLIYIGYKLGENWKVLIGFMKRYNKYSLIGFILILAIYFLVKILFKNNKK